jgi:F-type H+-transporting ATPase subunit c
MSPKKKLALAAASLTTLIASSAFAQEAAGRAANEFDMKAMAVLAAGICMGLAVLGGGLGQGRAAAAALEGISRNPGAAPRIQTPMLIALALIESLVLFALALGFSLWAKA